MLLSSGSWECCRPDRKQLVYANYGAYTDFSLHPQGLRRRVQPTHIPRYSKIVTTAFNRVGLHLGCVNSVFFPIQPLLVNIAFQTKKGCSAYYKPLRVIKNSKISQAGKENKWHREIGKTYSVDFWNKAYFYTSSIKYDNKLKWMQYQIVRNCQYTNLRVNKFKPYISPLCSFCAECDETISHLYFGCRISKDFWHSLAQFLANSNILVPIHEATILFGFHNEDPNSVSNTIILWAKSYIWNVKFKNVHPSLDAFKSILKQRLVELKELFEFNEKEDKILPWSLLMNIMI